ncbi:VCBS repeat-containing protein [bacterium CPR1]|nr:VCBS repeat-containing protein [bacterium CPR1]
MSRGWLLIILALSALFASACSSGSGGGGGGALDKGAPVPTGQNPGATGRAAITFDLQGRQARISDAAVNILINILDPVTQQPLAQPVTVPVDRSGATQTVTIAVPVGDVLLLIETLDANGNVLDVGSGVVSVTENSTSSISITLRPFDQNVVGIPSKLVFVNQPQSAGQNQSLGTVQVAVQDGNGLLIASATDSITLAINTNPAGGILAGTVTANAVNGVATFDTLSINNPGAGYTLIAAATNRNSDVSASFDIAAVPESLAVSVPPTNTPQLSPITPPVQVSILDENGVVVPGATNAVTVSLASGAGTLSGSLTVNAVDGVATFPDLSIDQVGTGFSLGFSSPGLAGVTSGTFDTTNAPGVPTGVEFVVQPSTTDINQTITPPVQVRIVDFFGATVPGATNDVTLVLAAGPGNLNGTLNLSAVNGVAVFNNLSLDAAGVGFVLAASSPGLTGASSSTFNINAVVGPPIVFLGARNFVGIDSSGNPRYAAPRSCVVADFNSDGRDDFAQGDEINTGDPTVHLNTTANGAMVPTFSPFFVNAGGGGAFGVGSADLNNDGRPDLGSNGGNGNLEILLNQTPAGGATAIFGPVSVFPTGTGSLGNFDFADFNADGLADVVLETGAGFSVRVNNTAVPPGTIVSFNAPNPVAGSSGSVTAGDVDGDGRPDVVQGGNGSMFVTLNTTPNGALNATFGAPVSFLPIGGGTVDRCALGDFDGDGDLDVVSADRAEARVRIWRNQTPLGGPPNFVQHSLIAAGQNPLFTLVDDFNADGRADIAASNFSGGGVTASPNKNSMSVFLNQNLPGAIAFQPVNNFPTTRTPLGIGAGDFNNDGILDVGVASDDGFGYMTSILLGTTPNGATAASFLQGNLLQAGNGPSGVADADFNGDGASDLIVSNRTDGTATVYTNDGAGGLTPSAPFTVGSQPVATYVTDLNGDLQPDAFVVNNFSSNITVLMNTTGGGGGAPTFNVANFSVGAQPQRAAVADINRDGRPDIAIGLVGGGFVRVFMNTTPAGNPTATFDPTPTDIPFSDPTFVVAGDFNSDGIVDLASTGNTFGELVVFPNTTALGSNTASFGATVSVSNFIGRVPLASADINADGRPDLVTTSGNLAVYMNTSTPGTVSFQRTDVGNLAGNLFVLAEDANSDGLPDLVMGDANGYDVVFVRNTTAVGSNTPSFDAPLYFLVGDYFDIPSNSFFGFGCVADLTGDGLEDLAVVAPGTGSLNPSILGNLIVLPQQ